MSYRHPHIKEVTKGQILTGRELLRRQFVQKYEKAQQQDVNSFPDGGFMGLDWSNPFKGEGAAQLKSGAFSAGINMVGSLANKGLSGGLSSGAGNVIGSLSNVASAIPGPWGAVASGALQVIGGLTNRMFGSKINEEKVAEVKNDMASMDANIATAGDYNTLENNMQGDISFTKKDIGKDGWFSNKASNLYKKLHSQAEILNQRKDISALTSANQIAERTTDNLLRNYAAYGGDLNKEGRVVTGQELLRRQAEKGVNKFDGLTQQSNTLKRLRNANKSLETFVSVNSRYWKDPYEENKWPALEASYVKLKSPDNWDEYMSNFSDYDDTKKSFKWVPEPSKQEENTKLTTNKAGQQPQTINTKAVVTKTKKIVSPPQSQNTALSTNQNGNSITAEPSSAKLNQPLSNNSTDNRIDYNYNANQLKEPESTPYQLDDKGKLSQESINQGWIGNDIIGYYNTSPIKDPSRYSYGNPTAVDNNAINSLKQQLGGNTSTEPEVSQFKNINWSNIWKDASSISKSFAQGTAHRGTVTPISQTGNAVFDSIGNSVAGTMNIVDTLMKANSKRWNDNRTLSQKIGLAEGGSLKDNRVEILTGRELLRRQIADRVNKFSGEDTQTNAIQIAGNPETYINAGLDTIQLVGNAIDQGSLSVTRDEINQAQQGTQRGGQVVTGYDIIEANRPQPMQHVNRYDFRKNTVGMDVVNGISAGNTGAMAGYAMSNSPWGAAIGGTVGTLSSVAGSLIGRHKAKKEAEKMNYLVDLGNARNDLAYNTSIQQTAERQVDNLLQNWAAYGGLLGRRR